MATFRQAGGPGGRGNFRLTWQGSTVLQEINQKLDRGLAAEAQEIRADLFTSLHKISGDNARSSFADVEVRGEKRTLVIGAAMPYTVYEEMRHPIIRAVADRHVGHITQAIQEALS
jgi:hypothetical protein